MLDFLGDLRRTHMCGALRASDAGKKATLMGWVNKRRDLGSLIFVDLRDRTGVTQVVINAERDAAIHKKAEALRNEYVIAVTGTVKLRDASTVNKNIATGEVELVAEELRILNESKLPPFLPSDPLPEVALLKSTWHIRKNPPSIHSHFSFSVTFPPGPMELGFTSPSRIHEPTRTSSFLCSGAGLGVLSCAIAAAAKTIPAARIIPDHLIASLLEEFRDRRSTLPEG